MNIVGQQVLSDAGGIKTVEWVAEGGDVISVRLQSSTDNLSVDDAVTKAKALMVQVATFGEVENDDADEVDATGSPAVQSLRSARSAKDTGTLEERFVEGLKNSFPASDPPSATGSTIPAGRAQPDTDA